MRIVWKGSAIVSNIFIRLFNQKLQTLIYADCLSEIFIKEAHENTHGREAAPMHLL
jgi:hypothetical protein